MGDSLLYKLRSGKPPKIFFFLKGYLWVSGFPRLASFLLSV